MNAMDIGIWMLLSKHDESSCVLRSLLHCVALKGLCPVEDLQTVAKDERLEVIWRLARNLARDRRIDLIAATQVLLSEKVLADGGALLPHYLERIFAIMGERWIDDGRLGLLITPLAHLIVICEQAVITMQPAIANKIIACYERELHRVAVRQCRQHGGSGNILLCAMQFVFFCITDLFTL